MTYSRTTNEVLRELNDLIVSAKETAELARRCDLPWYKDLWNSIADHTDVHVEKLKNELERVASIAEHPDEISIRFNIIKAIDDIAFLTQALSFSAGLTIARAKPEDNEIMQPLCKAYKELAMVCALKSQKVSGFLSELSSMIFEDMRITVAKKVKDATQIANDAADKINGYNYIKNAIEEIATVLNTTPITIKMLEDERSKIEIITFAIFTDILRSGGRDREMFDGVDALKSILDDAIGFIKSLPLTEPETLTPNTVKKAFEDISFQASFLLFYLHGEVEKLSKVQLDNASLLDDDHIVAFTAVFNRINHLIQFAHDSDGETAFNKIEEILIAIHSDILSAATALNEYGGVIRFIAESFTDMIKERKVFKVISYRSSQ